MIQLPSERTLRDYSNFSKQKTGFHDDLNDQLLAEAQLDRCSEAQKHVALVFDEMKIRDDLVYRKTTQEIVGFVDLGQVSNEMGDLEKSLSQSAVSQTPINDVATHMLVLMIRGINSGLSFPWAHPHDGHLRGKSDDHNVGSRRNFGDAVVQSALHHIGRSWPQQEILPHARCHHEASK